MPELLAYHLYGDGDAMPSQIRAAPEHRPHLQIGPATPIPEENESHLLAAKFPKRLRVEALVKDDGVSHDLTRLINASVCEFLSDCPVPVAAAFVLSIGSSQ